jgi:hypothetical protein
MAVQVRITELGFQSYRDAGIPLDTVVSADPPDPPAVVASSLGVAAPSAVSTTSSAAPGMAAVTAAMTPSGGPAEGVSHD